MINKEQRGRDQIIQGDTLRVLQRLPDKCVSECITSPPYWSLRDYQTANWEGGDPDCDHKAPVAHGYNAKIGNTRKGVSCFYKDVCAKCGAKRVDLQIGLESSPEAFLDRLWRIFDEVHRVLRDDGTCWVNFGDSYISAQSRYSSNTHTISGGKDRNEPVKRGHPFYQDKCLAMIPERFAFGLIEHGWVLRNKCIWFKKNSMPSSVKDRFSNRWEYLFFFTKKNRTLWRYNIKTGQVVDRLKSTKDRVEGIDWEWKEVGAISDNNFNVRVRDAGKDRFIQKATDEEIKDYGKPKFKKVSLWRSYKYFFDLDSVRIPHKKASLERVQRPWDGHREPMSSYQGMDISKMCHSSGKNPGDIWTIATQSYKGAHFSTYPEKLIIPPIKAGCPQWICKKCGKARVRIVEPTKEYAKFLGSWHDGNTNKNKTVGQRKDDTKGHRTTADYQTIGWSDCQCGAGFRPGIVLDIFAGSGTTCAVAKLQERDYLGIELNPDYIQLAEKRIAKAVIQADKEKKEREKRERHRQELIRRMNNKRYWIKML